MNLAIALNDKNNKFSNKENKYTAAKYYHMGLSLDYKAYTRYHQDTYGWVVFMVSRNYLNLIANEHNSITMNKYILGGMPAIKGTRIPVSLILSCFRDNMKKALSLSLAFNTINPSLVNWHFIRISYE